ncbi:TPA: aminopeptidase [Candidatus Acetothermia bacterium]|nr:aminopeptidase [Candidatus Acetothermia bacterium]
MEHGVRVGRMAPGATNSLTDVDGVMVGHTTLIDGSDVRTGVTTIIPHPGNVFYEKVKAAAVTINGFGKTVGLPQINELGTIETPILLTNTLSVGKVSDALVSWALEHYQLPECPITSLNPVIAECNDSYLNDIQGRHVEKEHVFHALDSVSEKPVEEGVVGAGVGVSAFEFKSGIGSASRIVRLGREDYTLGVLSLPNFGRREELVIKGVPIGLVLRDCERGTGEHEQGSIVIVIATDIPLSHRQLIRIAKRASFGIARTGGICHNTSGEFVISFTTANKVSHDPKRIFLEERRLNDAHSVIDAVFQATIEAVEESILSALFSAETMEGIDGHRRGALPIPEVLSLLKASRHSYS